MCFHVALSVVCYRKVLVPRFYTVCRIHICIGMYVVGELYGATSSTLACHASDPGSIPGPGAFHDFRESGPPNPAIEVHKPVHAQCRSPSPGKWGGLRQEGHPA